MLVQEVMPKKDVTAFPTDSVPLVGIKMLRRHCEALPVIDEHLNLIGLVPPSGCHASLLPQFWGLVT